MYEYRVTPLRVLDGDTAQFSIDLGLNVHKTEILRFYGIDTPETNSSDPVVRAAGLAAKARVEGVLMSPTNEVKVQTEKPYSQDKYGRWLGKVFFKSPASTEWICLNDALVEAGLAKVYLGGAK
jgi:endonuclease YncB( thermonuclease family)